MDALPSLKPEVPQLLRSRETLAFLGLELIGEQPVELADRTQRNQLVIAGSVRFFGETREVQIMLTDSEDAYIGTKLLEQSGRRGTAAIEPDTIGS